MLVIPNSLKLQTTTCRTKTLALCWKITLLETGTVFRFTDFPHELSVRESDTPTFQTYTPTDGVDASARRRADELEPSNKETRGVISSTAVKGEDLRAGLFDGAQVDEFLVDARMPWIGYVDHARYYIKQVKYDRGTWKAEIDGAPTYLSQPQGDAWGPQCLVDLFSAECGVDPTTVQKAVEITSILEQRRQFRVTMTGGNESTGWADNGTIVWTSGDHNGLTHEVKEYTNVSGTLTITLHIPTPYDLVVGDDANLRPGCNKLSGEGSTTGDCNDKFSNLVNFQGYEWIPGRDDAHRGTPIR